MQSVCMEMQSYMTRMIQLTWWVAQPWLRCTRLSINARSPPTQAKNRRLQQAKWLRLKSALVWSVLRLVKLELELESNCAYRHHFRQNLWVLRLIRNWTLLFRVELHVVTTQGTSYQIQNCSRFLFKENEHCTCILYDDFHQKQSWENFILLAVIDKSFNIS